jgi:hypothetical protein
VGYIGGFLRALAVKRRSNVKVRRLGRKQSYEELSHGLGTVWAIVGVSLRLSSALYSVSRMMTPPNDQVPPCCVECADRASHGLFLSGERGLVNQVTTLSATVAVALAERWTV